MNRSGSLKRVGEYKEIKQEMEQRMSRSNSFVNSLQFRGMNILGGQSNPPQKPKSHSIQQ